MTFQPSAFRVENAFETVAAIPALDARREPVVVFVVERLR